MKNQTHERYWDHEIAHPSSERSFGFVMAAVFAVLTLANIWHDGRAWPWTSAIAAFFLICAWFRPAALRSLNLIWFKLGSLLHKVVNPVVMAIVFFGTVLPTGLIMRALGKNPLRLEWKPNTSTYWVDRQPPGPAPESMKDQF